MPFMQIKFDKKASGGLVGGFSQLNLAFLFHRDLRMQSVFSSEEIGLTKKKT